MAVRKSLRNALRRHRRIKFRRYLWYSKKSLEKSGWRRPRGIHNKLRKEKKGKGRLVKVGYRIKREWRGLHPSGHREVLVHNLNELLKVKEEVEEDIKEGEESGVVIRIASTVGAKKREIIVAEAEKMGLRVLNP
ncbi:MAG: hypothetical protein OCU22_04305 [Canidatus Methanoxibalbensis ujae]|nr:hypothetical protein [Candidatus Methanoxibalbensis ujae]